MTKKILNPEDDFALLFSDIFLKSVLIVNAKRKKKKKKKKKEKKRTRNKRKECETCKYSGFWKLEGARPDKILTLGSDYVACQGLIKFSVSKILPQNNTFRLLLLLFKKYFLCVQRDIYDIQGFLSFFFSFFLYLMCWYIKH